MELSERKKKILRAIVDNYIQTAEPVGSKTIAAEMTGKVSSATIRNELADLTEMGYLEQPHTSAGRIPSPKGYRFYVNELMESQALSEDERVRIDESLQLRGGEMDRMMTQAGKALSSIVNYPTYMATTRKRRLTVRRFDLLGVDGGNCIAVVMMSNDRVKSQLLQLQLDVTAEQLPILVNLLNTHFVNISVSEMSQKLMSVAEQIPPQLFLLLSQAVNYAAELLEEADKREIVTAGASQLLKIPEFRDADKAHDLMSFLADSKESLPVLDDGPMKILIGPENVDEALKDTSVIIASYDIGDDMRGLIGVVGPTRMDYATVAARLSGFAEGLTRMFGKNLPPKEDTEQ